MLDSLPRPRIDISVALSARLWNIDGTSAASQTMSPLAIRLHEPEKGAFAYEATVCCMSSTSASPTAGAATAAHAASTRAAIRGTAATRAAIRGPAATRSAIPRPRRHSRPRRHPCRHSRHRRRSCRHSSCHPNGCPRGSRRRSRRMRRRPKRLQRFCRQLHRPLRPPLRPAFHRRPNCHRWFVRRPPRPSLRTRFFPQSSRRRHWHWSPRLKCAPADAVPSSERAGFDRRPHTRRAEKREQKVSSELGARNFCITSADSRPKVSCGSRARRFR